MAELIQDEKWFALQAKKYFRVVKNTAGNHLEPLTSFTGDGAPLLWLKEDLHQRRDSNACMRQILGARGSDQKRKKCTFCLLAVKICSVL